MRLVSHFVCAPLQLLFSLRLFVSPPSLSLKMVFQHRLDNEVSCAGWVCEKFGNWRQIYEQVTTRFEYFEWGHNNASEPYKKTSNFRKIRQPEHARTSEFLNDTIWKNKYQGRLNKSKNFIRLSLKLYAAWRRAQQVDSTGYSSNCIR
jgi:hypothetical protein